MDVKKDGGRDHLIRTAREPGETRQVIPLTLVSNLGQYHPHLLFCFMELCEQRKSWICKTFLRLNVRSAKNKTARRECILNKLGVAFDIGNTFFSKGEMKTELRYLDSRNIKFVM